MKKDDPRIKAAFEWIKNHYSIDEHPGFPFDRELSLGERRSQQGLYYYYLVMSKALSVYGEKVVETPDGVKHFWANELAERLLKLQDKNGFWKNDNRRWWEDDPVLTTSYVITILNILLGELPVD
ncbi:MAG: hypothetical protein HY606_01850 [Planctomycetes bacterium]|nr:hypothetical protein [Planctomycetota bacterium]